MHEGEDSRPAESAPPVTPSPGALDGRLDWSSPDTLTESILRRIMRVACAVGSLGFISAVVTPVPPNRMAIAIAAFATVALFALTYVPMRVRWLSLIYPWSLVAVGGALAHLMGPRAEMALLLAGGLFIGSLVVKTPALVMLCIATGVIVGTAPVLHRGPLSPELAEAWMAINLAGNAKDAMEQGGTLTLELTLDHGTAEAVVRVSDSGSGIPPDLLPLIFDPFFTTKPAGRGTGLGLANVRQLIEGMHGTVRVESTVGRGTSFELRLPTTTAEVTAPTSRSSVASQRTATILVVDDDVRVRAVAYSTLERAGHRVLEAPSVPAALEAARAHRGRIDLLLTDVVMAGGGGAEAIRSVRAVIPSIRVLVMSGYANDEALRRGIAEREFPFVAKPFTADELTTAVAQALAGELS